LLLLLVAVGCDSGIKQNYPTPTGDDTGPVGGAQLVFGVESVDFGDLAFGQLAQSTVSVNNPGGEDLVISSITVDAPFSVSPPYLTLFADGFSTITVFVQPTTYATFDQEITLVTDDPDVGTVILPVTGTTISDADGDGHMTSDADGGDDCDDDDATVYPGADEIWYDGVDENCDGLNDYDQDADGYDAQTDDHNPGDGNADCNDINAAYHPGADDAPYDNADTNCDGQNDWDADDDGYEVTPRGSDCNDDDPTVNRGEDERFDGQDSDCDGEVDNDSLAELSPYIYSADGTWDRAGYAVALGDLDADGDNEVIIGAPYFGAANAGSSGKGYVAISEGPSLLATGTAINRFDNTFDGTGSSDLLGGYVTVIGDHDGDGENELAVGATGAGGGVGSIYVLAGYDALHGDQGDAMATYSGTASSSFGRGIGTDIDLDGDGMVELVGMYASGSSNYVAIEYGSTNPNSAFTSTMDANYSTDGTEVAFYRNAPVGGDLDGDGYTDLVLSDGSADYNGVTDSGAVWVLWGQTTPYTTGGATADIETRATTIAYGTSSSAYVGWSTQLGDDWDADGDDELWIYDAGDGLYVVPGGPTRRSSFTVADAAAVYYAWDSRSTDAEMIRNAGDWDGDGLGDMMVYLEDESGSYGSSEMFSSTFQSGTYDEVDDRIGDLGGSSDHENSDVGYGLSPRGGDLDGDGDADQLVGDPGYTTNAGEVYVLVNAHE
jgi:hypothetical protein